MQQWEQRAVVKDVNQFTDEQMSELGKDGWRISCVTSISDSILCFVYERPILQPSTAEKIFNEVKDEVEGGHMEVKTTS